MSEPIKFMPLYSDSFKPAKPYGHVMHFASWTLKEVVENGWFDIFLKRDDMTGWDIETNGLDPSRSDFRWSGMGCAFKGTTDDINTNPIYSHPRENDMDWRDYTAVWIEFRGYEEYLPQVAAFLTEMDAQVRIMAHNGAYEFKCAFRNLNIELWNLQDSRAYLAAGFFGRMALKMNAKTLVNAHEWEDECTTLRKKSMLPTEKIGEDGTKERIPGYTEEEAWGNLPVEIVGPYCGWDCVYTLSMCEEIIRRSEVLRNPLDGNGNRLDYPEFSPIWETQEVYRRQIILAGMIDDKGVPTTKEAFESFLAWGLQHEIQHKTWFCHRMGIEIDPAFLSDEIGVDLSLPWSNDVDVLMKQKEEVDAKVSLDKRGKDYNYNLWNNLVFNVGGATTFRKFIDKQHADNNWRDSLVSSWRHWSGMGEFVTTMRKDTTTMMFQSSDEDLMSGPSVKGISLAKMRWTKQVGKMVGDALAYEKRPQNEAGQTLPMHKGRFESDIARLHFSWNPVSKETRRWGSGFHIVSPNARVHDIFDCGDGRIQIHADLSGAEIQMSSAQAGDIATLEAFIDGLDLHLRNAANSYRIPESEVTKDMRNVAKLITFRLLFGSTVEGIAGALGIEMEAAMAIVNAFFDANPELKKFLDWGKEFAETYECRCSIFGDLLGLSWDAIATKYHNIIVQHSSSNTFGLGLFDLQRAMVRNNFDAWLFGFVHDSTDIDSPVRNMFKVISLMRRTIVDQQLTHYGVPARLDYEICANGGKFHASHFHGTGSEENPWIFEVAPGLVQDAEVLLAKMKSRFHVEVMDTTNEDGSDYTTVQDVIMAPLEYKTFPSFENERPLPKVGYKLKVWSDFDEDHTRDLSEVEGPMDKSLINCDWPKKVAPMYEGD